MLELDGTKLIQSSPTRCHQQARTDKKWVGMTGLTSTIYLPLRYRQSVYHNTAGKCYSWTIQAPSRLILANILLIFMFHTQTCCLKLTKRGAQGETWFLALPRLDSPPNKRRGGPGDHSLGWPVSCSLIANHAVATHRCYDDRLQH